MRVVNIFEKWLYFYNNMCYLLFERRYFFKNIFVLKICFLIFLKLIFFVINNRKLMMLFGKIF